MQSTLRSAFKLTPNRVRFTAVFCPAPGISNSQFKKYWLQEHGKKFLSLDIARKNLTKYEQVGLTLFPCCLSSYELRTSSTSTTSLARISLQQWVPRRVAGHSGAWPSSKPSLGTRSSRSSHTQTTSGSYTPTRRLSSIAVGRKSTRASSRRCWRRADSG